jgi:mannose-6-phosphate isomerase-like protein (cupin superfamily)
MPRCPMKIIPCCIALLSLVPVIVAQTPAAATAPKPPAAILSGSAIFDWNELKPEERPNGQRRATFDNPTETLANFECHITTLKVGETSGAAHAHNGPTISEEAILIKEGTVEVVVNDTKRTVGPGSVIYFAPKDLTALRNVGKTPATYFVISVRATPPAAK